MSGKEATIYSSVAVTKPVATRELITRDSDLFADDVMMLDEQHATAALPGLRRAHHAGSASANDDDVRGQAQ